MLYFSEASCTVAEYVPIPFFNCGTFPALTFFLDPRGASRCVLKWVQSPCKQRVEETMSHNPGSESETGLAGFLFLGYSENKISFLL